jgi:hypothetical protein
MIIIIAIRYGPIRYGPIRYGPIRYGPIRRHCFFLN